MSYVLKVTRVTISWANAFNYLLFIVYILSETCNHIIILIIIYFQLNFLFTSKPFGKPLSTRTLVESKNKIKVYILYID